MDNPFPDARYPMPSLEDIDNRIGDAEVAAHQCIADIYGYAEACEANALNAGGAIYKLLEQDVNRRAASVERTIGKVAKTITNILDAKISDIQGQIEFASNMKMPCIDPRTGEPLHLLCAVGESNLSCCVRYGFSEQFCKSCFDDSPPPPPPNCQTMCDKFGNVYNVCEDADQRRCYDTKTGKEVECPDSALAPCSEDGGGSGGGDGGNDGGKCCPPAVINVTPPACPPPVIKNIINVPPCDKGDEDEDDEEEEPKCVEDITDSCAILNCAPPARAEKIGYTANVPFDHSPGLPKFWNSACGYPTIETFLARFDSVGDVLSLWAFQFPGKAVLGRTPYPGE